METLSRARTLNCVASIVEHELSVLDALTGQGNENGIALEHSLKVLMNRADYQIGGGVALRRRTQASIHERLKKVRCQNRGLPLVG